MTTTYRLNGRELSLCEAAIAIGNWKKMSEEPWRPYIDTYCSQKSRPWDHDRIQIYRKEWDEPQILNWPDINPYLNAEGLMWRPWDWA